MEIRAFIGSSAEAEDYAVELRAILQRLNRVPGKAHSIAVDLWRYVFPENYGFFETLNAAVDRYDFAFFVGDADDRVSRRGAEVETVRDNVLFEFGLFLGALGRDRCYLVVPDDFRVTLPSDLAGVSVHTWSSEDADNPPLAVDAVARALNRQMREVGPRHTAVSTVARPQLNGPEAEWLDDLAATQPTDAPAQNLVDAQAQLRHSVAAEQTSEWRKLGFLPPEWRFAYMPADDLAGLASIVALECQVEADATIPVYFEDEYYSDPTARIGAWQYKMRDRGYRSVLVVGNDPRQTLNIDAWPAEFGDYMTVVNFPTTWGTDGLPEEYVAAVGAEIRTALERALNRAIADSA